MFYCDDCAEKNGYPQSIIRSVGPCEVCGKVDVCSDMPSSNLPKPEEKLEKHIEIGLDMIGPPAEGIPVAEQFVGEWKKREIEKMAWQIFLSKTGLRFTRELTAEEKKQVIDVDGYYFEQAEKLYEKRQRALLNKKYPVIEVPADGKSDWGEGGYCLCFVYSKYNGNFVLKGYLREVKEYLKKNYTHYFYNLSIWHQGFSRDIWYFWKKDIGIFDVTIKERKKGKKTQIRPYSSYGDDLNKMSEEELKAKTFYFKRLPKRWIPEFDKL